MVGTIMVDVVRLWRRRQPSPDSPRPAALDSRDGASRSGRSPRAPASTRRRRSPAAAYSSAPTTAASTGSISPAARKSGKYEAASPVTSSPAVPKGKVVVATADGQVICFGSRQTPTVDSVSQREYSSHFHSSSMQREADERS